MTTEALKSLKTACLCSPGHCLRAQCPVYLSWPKQFSLKLILSLICLLLFLLRVSHYFGVWLRQVCDVSCPPTFLFFNVCFAILLLLLLKFSSFSQLLP